MWSEKPEKKLRSSQLNKQLDKMITSPKTPSPHKVHKGGKVSKDGKVDKGGKGSKGGKVDKAAASAKSPDQMKGSRLGLSSKAP